MTTKAFLSVEQVSKVNTCQVGPLTITIKEVPIFI